MRFRFGAVWFLGLIGFVGAASALGAPELIRPGEVWLDDRGKPIQAHGGGITRAGDLFYWFGEDRTRGLDPARRFVSCYSSADLAHWKFCGDVLKLLPPEGLGADFVVERPKVFYSASLKQFVMYFHLDEKYAFARVGVAVCDSIDGEYKYLKSFRPLDHESRDIGQFVDEDGSGYLIFEDRPFGFRIARLSDDLLSVQKEICLVPQHMEGGAIVRVGDLYYVLGSKLTGWKANANQYATSQSLAGPWSVFRDIAPASKDTYGSQSSMLVKIVGSKATAVIFMGDIWKEHALWDSRYLWMPVTVADGKMILPPPGEWTIDVATAEATVLEKK